MNRRYALIFDRTGSMSEPVSRHEPKGLARIDAAKESAIAVVGKLQEFNPEGGVDFYLFNQKFVKQPNATPASVAELFKKTDPYGSTDFVPVLKDAIDAHFKGNAPSTIIVVTDGEPSGNGRRTLADLLISTANRLESDTDLAITFFQIGDSQEATAFLKSLDDDLVRVGHAKFDIVDTKTSDEIGEIGLTEALLAAVND